MLLLCIYKSSVYYNIWCENWTIKKAEYQRIDWCFRTVDLEKTLKSPLDNRRLNQSILKEINPEYSFEGQMLKLKLQYFGHLIWRANSLEKPWCWERLRAGGEGGDRGWDGWRWWDGITESIDMSLSKLWEIVKDRGAWLAVVHGVTKSQTQLSDWTVEILQLIYYYIILYYIILYGRYIEYVFPLK